MDKKIYYYLDKVESLIAGNPEMPVTVEIDPSNRCQLDCDFCMFKALRKIDPIVPGSPDKPDLPYDVYKHLLLDLKRVGVKSITFTGGGEPLLNENFNRMVLLAYRMGFEYGLITNGLRLHKVDRLDRFRFIRISLDAGSREVYHKLKKADAFDTVVGNIRRSVMFGSVTGLSYVVNEINREDIVNAQRLSKVLGVKYIQFKPAWIDGEPYLDYVIPGEDSTIDTRRYKAADKIPCAIAGLIGIVGADAHVYYCCQYRGNRKYGLGSLYHATFPEIWKRRPQLIPDIERCPNCRYMNYTRAYKNFANGNSLFFKHRHFL